MDLSIRHETTYVYDAPVAHGLQRLRLIPTTGATQQVHEWRTEIEGGVKQVEFTDHFANPTELVSIATGVTTLHVVAEGRVRTIDTSGIISTSPGLAPLWLYRRATPLTEAGPAVDNLVASLEHAESGSIALMHALSEHVASEVGYEIGHTTTDATAEDVLAAGHGVCQDHAHVFLAAARTLGFPARYVSGYLFMAGTDRQDATHAWVEVWIDDLGWIGLDPSNGISPDEKYVRIATGLDYTDASPISGIRFGVGDERLDVTLQIQQ